jgi:hypothetical protein
MLVPDQVGDLTLVLNRQALKLPQLRAFVSLSLLQRAETQRIDIS